MLFFAKTSKEVDIVKFCAIIYNILHSVTKSDVFAVAARMVSEADTAFQLYLGDSTAYELSEIITEISKNKPSGRTTR